MRTSDGRVVLGPFQDEPYDFPPEEQAAIAGSPARPNQPPGRRALYFIVSLMLCAASGLGNALVSVNASYLMGPLGVDGDQVAWAPVAYSMTYVSMNLLVVRFRQQFGLRIFAMTGLMAFCAVMGLHILVGGLAGAVLIHAAAGVAGAPLAALSVYYMMTALPPQSSVKGVVVILGLLQIATPLAGAFSAPSIAIDDLRTLYMFEFGVALVCLGSVTLLRLPPSQRIKVFEPLDLVTFVFFASGAACLCAVLGLGATDWWTDRAWIGWTLAASIPLLGVAFYIEANRARPLLDLKFLSGPDLIRFALVAVTARILLSEQSTATSLLNLLGVSNEELHFYYVLMFLAGVAGAVLSAAIFKPERIGPVVAVSLLLVAIAALLNAYSSGASRAPEFYLSQMLITFALAFFIGPTLLFGIVRVLKAGGGVLPSLLVVFVSTQTMGALIGGAFLNTYQTIREKADSAQLIDRVQGFQAPVAHRISEFAASLSGTTLNPGARAGGGAAMLQEEMTRQADILGYDNTFMLVALLAGVAAIYLMIAIATHRVRTRRPGGAAPSMATSGARP